MTNGQRIPPTPHSERRDMLQALTSHLEVADPALTRLSLPRAPLELWGHHIASVMLRMDVQADGVPAVGYAWGVALVATIALVLVGLWFLRHC